MMNTVDTGKNAHYQVIYLQAICELYYKDMLSTGLHSAFTLLKCGIQKPLSLSNETWLAALYFNRKTSASFGNSKD